MQCFSVLQPPVQMLEQCCSPQGHHAISYFLLTIRGVQCTSECKYPGPPRKASSSTFGKGRLSCSQVACLQVGASSKWGPKPLQNRKPVLHGGSGVQIKKLPMSHSGVMRSRHPPPYLKHPGMLSFSHTILGTNYFNLHSLTRSHNDFNSVLCCVVLWCLGTQSSA